MAGDTYDWVKQANAELEEQVWQDTQKTYTPLPAEEAARKAEAELKPSWWGKNGSYIMDGAGNILDAVTKIVVATQGSYDPNQYYTGPDGYVQYNPNYYPRRSSGMSATTKIVLFGALGAAIIVGAVLYKKSKRKKRREEREREEEYEYRRTSKRRRR